MSTKPGAGQIAYPSISGSSLNWRLIKDQVVYVRQEENSWRGTPRENLHFASTVRYNSIEERARIVEDHVFKFDLGQYIDTNWGQLTGGIRARFSLVRALLLKPKLLILDEPVSHTDPYWTNLYLEELYRLSKWVKEEDITVIFSSQNIDVAETICDKLLILDRGKLQFFGTFDELDNVHDDVELEIEVYGSEDSFLTAIEDCHPIKVVPKKRNRYRISVKKSSPLNTMLSKLLLIDSLRITYFRNLNYSSIRLLERTYKGREEP